MTRPVFVIVCGINGAGKSTLADALARSPDSARLSFLNPDRLSVSYRVADSALSRETADIRALRHIGGETHRLLAGRQSFVSETVGANAAYRRYVEGAKAAGYWSASYSRAWVRPSRALPGWHCGSASADTRSQRRTSAAAGQPCMPT